MKKIIEHKNIRSFAYTNENTLDMPIKGIVISFFGLGGMRMFDEDTDEGKYFGKRNILYVIPYNNPWAWMNKQAVSYTDEIIDVLIDYYKLRNDIPIVSTGGSMGGQSALVYTIKSKRTPVACVVNCPVGDLPYHYTERPDLPRTLYSAFYHENGSVEEVLKKASPLHLVEEMPFVHYYIFHCMSDTAVNISNHSDKLVDKMVKIGLDVVYNKVPERNHCDLTPEMWELYRKFICDSIEK